MDPLLELKDLACGYQDTTIVEDLSFSIRKGSIACLLGPSGCGKTTTLRAIAGFEPLISGSISVNQKVISSVQKVLPPEKRNIGMVFQDYALFPHLTIRENVCFGLKQHSKSQQLKLADQYLELVRLEDSRDKMPDELSGGQQQRVALARALAPQPDLILMDEPFSNLDIDLRRRLAADVRDILKSANMTCILVTHDQEEAFSLADHVGVFHRGKMVQWDTPFNIYHEPADRFVANFIGLGHFIRGTAHSHEEIQTEFGVIKGNRAYSWPTGTQVDLLVRPDDVVAAEDGGIKAQITNKTFTGASTLYTLKLETGAVIDAFFPSHIDHAVSETVGIDLKMDHLIAFETSSD